MVIVHEKPRGAAKSRAGPAPFRELITVIIGISFKYRAGDPRRRLLSRERIFSGLGAAKKPFPKNDKTFFIFYFFFHLNLR